MVPEQVLDCTSRALTLERVRNWSASPVRNRANVGKRSHIIPQVLNGSAPRLASVWGQSTLEELETSFIPFLAANWTGWQSLAWPECAALLRYSFSYQTSWSNTNLISSVLNGKLRSTAFMAQKAGLPLSCWCWKIDPETWYIMLVDILSQDAPAPRNSWYKAFPKRHMCTLVLVEQLAPPNETALCGIRCQVH